jgi:hypothetical protein
MQVQDLKDQIGDRARSRSTAPLVIGEESARWSLAVPIALWGPICALHCKADFLFAAAVVCFGAYVAVRCLRFKGPAQDRWTWQLWCAWTAILSVLPLSRIVSEQLGGKVFG